MPMVVPHVYRGFKRGEADAQPDADSGEYLERPEHGGHGQRHQQQALHVDDRVRVDHFLELAPLTTQKGLHGTPPVEAVPTIRLHGDQGSTPYTGGGERCDGTVEPDLAPSNRYHWAL